MDSSDLTLRKQRQVQAYNYKLKKEEVRYGITNNVSFASGSGFAREISMYRPIYVGNYVIQEADLNTATERVE
jgi:hypothetical protein